MPSKAVDLSQRVPYLLDRDYARYRRTSGNSLWAKFPEFVFQARGRIKARGQGRLSKALLLRQSSAFS
jgi:hypothetical protein